MAANIRTHPSPAIFIVCVFALSLPFWLLGALTDGFLPKEIPINLPISALMAFNPMIVALLLVFRASGTEGVKALLKRTFDYKKIPRKIWYLPIFLLMPFIMVVAYGLMTLMGTSMPDPQFPILLAPVLFGVFFIFAVGEEMGWQGYAYEPLEQRWQTLGASLILGVVWAVWHIVPYIQTHNTPTWILWQCIGTVGLRVLIVWLYNNTGKSLFAAITFHTTINLSTFMFPNYGSYYDPMIAALLIGIAAAAVAIVWGPKTLARLRY